MSKNPRRWPLIVVFLLVASAGGRQAKLAASDPGGGGDWPMWGGTPDRNMVSNMKGLPTEWDVKTKKNVKWVADLGSQSYGNAVVAGGMVFVGTNNEHLRDPKQPGDRGVLMAFRESTGEFMWQQTHEKLASGRANDWPYQGVASSPLVEGTHVYYVSNRGVVWCLDINGFRDGKNDGPVTDEKLTGPQDADVIWSFDMMEEVGSYPHNMSNSSPVIWGDLVFVSTSNGQDESHVHIPSPKAPAIIALNKSTGKLVWEDNSVEDRIPSLIRSFTFMPPGKSKASSQTPTPTDSIFSFIISEIHRSRVEWLRKTRGAMLVFRFRMPASTVESVVCSQRQTEAILPSRATLSSRAARASRAPSVPIRRRICCRLCRSKRRADG